MPIDPLGLSLLTIARNAIQRHFGAATTTVPAHPDLAHPGATFVTLTQQGELRGCIGSLTARRALATDVAENAIAAAFHDPRFVPLTERELSVTRVEVSLLQPAEPIEFTSEDEVISILCPGVDGLIFEHGSRRATFLPQVWESLPDPVQFLRHLKQKAGLPAEFWDQDVRLARYSVQKWKES